MKTLPTEFERNGWTFSQMARSSNAAIYRRSQPGIFCHYEVIRVQRHNGREMFGRLFPPAEFYPSSEQWGQAGWTFKTYEQALAKFREIENQQTKKEKP